MITELPCPLNKKHGYLHETETAIIYCRRCNFIKDRTGYEAAKDFLRHNAVRETKTTNTNTERTNKLKLAQAFPSNFLKADDLNGKNVTVEITEATFESIGQGRDAEDKIVLSFKGKEKKMIVNKTNANTIAKVTGSDDTDDWHGKKIILTAREVDYQGTPTLAIRVSLNKPDTAAKGAPKQDDEPSDNDEF